MAFKLAELFVEIGGNTKPLKAALGVARASLMGLVRFTAGLGRRIASNLFDGIKGAARSAFGFLKGGAIFGGIAAAGGIAYAVKKASDLNESINKMQVVFGQSSAQIQKDAEQMAAKLGVPKQEFIDGATDIGMLGKAAGQTQAQAAQMGAQFAKLAADAASFYNVPVDEALLKIRSGLSGEAEPLRRFGVLLNEEAVKLEAFRLGLTKGRGELTEGQKVMARSSLIFKGMKDASGDLERTQDSFSNRLREVWGRVQNLAASIGETLLPVAKSLLGVVSDLITKFGVWLTSHQDKVKGWVDRLKDAVRWVKVVIANIGITKVVVSEIGKNWVSVFAELFKTLAHNFKELARYFGEHLVAAIEKATKGTWIATFAEEIGLTTKGENFKPQRIAPPNLKFPDIEKDNQSLKEAMDKLREAFSADKAREKAAENAPPAPLPPEVPPEAQVTLPKKTKKEHAFMGLEDFAKRLQEGLYKDKDAKTTATGVTRLVGLQEKANNLLQNAFKPAPAVAAGPA